ncbi:hypothetical protein OIU78_017936 [Salix suchowensis]|nr:hypothetical protein OIU78_017936 [Salix suchowensis]
MAKAVAALSLLLLVLYLSSGGDSARANEQKTWCVAKPSQSHKPCIDRHESVLPMQGKEPVELRFSGTLASLSSLIQVIATASMPNPWSRE